MRKQIKRITSFGMAAGLVCLALSGCQTIAEDWASVTDRPRPQPTLVQHGLTVSFEPGSARLESIERNRVEDFLARYAANARDGLIVAGSGDNDIAFRQRETVAAYLRHMDLTPVSEEAGFGIEAPRENTVTVVLRQYVVTLPGCPDWTKNPVDTTDNLHYANWGCATAVNLGRMVAEPGDLARGRDLGVWDSNTASLSIRRYRVGKTKDLNPDQVNGETSGSDSE